MYFVRTTAFSSRKHYSKYSKLYSTEGLAAKYERNGDPTNVLKLEKFPILRPQKGQVLVKMLRSPINPSDINVIEGTYPIHPHQNYVGGEGVGEVIDVDESVKTLKIGDLVIPNTFGIGKVPGEHMLL